MDLGQLKKLPKCLVMGHNVAIQEAIVPRLNDAELHVFPCGSNTTEALRVLGQHEFQAIVVTQDLGMRDVLQILHLIHGQNCPIFVLGSTTKRHNFFNNHGATAYFSIPTQIDAFINELNAKIQDTVPTADGISFDLDGLGIGTILTLRKQKRLDDVVDKFIGTMPEWISEIEASAEEHNDFMVQHLAEFVVKAARELGANHVALAAQKLRAASVQGANITPALSELEDTFHIVFRSLLTLRHA